MPGALSLSVVRDPSNGFVRHSPTEWALCSEKGRGLLQASLVSTSGLRVGLYLNAIGSSRAGGLLAKLGKL